MIVSVWLHEDGARAVFELPEPASSVRLERGDAMRRETWRVVTPGAQLADDTLTSAEPRARFEVVIAPDPVEIDRVYPSLHRAGEGVVIFGPTLRVQGVETRVFLRPDAGGVAIPEHEAERGYAYLGPAAAVSQRQGLRVVAGDEVGPQLVELIAHEGEAALAYYRRQLELPGREPTIVVAASPGPFPYRGDTSHTTVLSLRFVDPRWIEPDPVVADHLAKFVRHEAFHLWNATNNSDTPPWLHEGGAEYAALVSAIDAGALTQEDGVAQLSSHLASCSEALGERALLASELSGWPIYACGVVLQWVADVEARGRSGGRRDTFAIWRDLLRAGEAGGYGIAELRAATGPAVALLLDDAGPERWGRLAGALAEHGVRIAETGDAVLEAPPLARAR